MTEQLTKALKLIDQVQFGKDCVSSGVARGIVLDQLRALLTEITAEAERSAKTTTLSAPAIFEPVSDFTFSAEPPLQAVETKEADPIRERDFRTPLGSPKSPRTRKKPT